MKEPSQNINYNILLIDCYPNQTTFPLNISTIKSYINNKTIFFAKCFDFGIKIKKHLNFTKEQELKLSTIEEIVNKLRNKNLEYTNLEKKHIHIINSILKKIDLEKYNNIGFSIMSTKTLGYSILISRIIKNKYPTKNIIFGGSMFNYNNKILTNSEIDFLVQGEGFTTVENILNHINKISLKHNSKNNKIYYKQNNKITELKQKINENISESIPIPDFDDYDKNDYSELTIPMRFIEGCGFNCSFCSDHNKKIKTQKLETVIEQIKYLKKKYNPKAFIFYNNNNVIVKNKKYFLKFALLLLKNNLRINYYMQDNPSGYDELTFKILKKTGCKLIFFGFENINDEILHAMKKPHKAQEALNIINKCHQYNIKTLMFYMTGFINETDEMFQKTKNFITTNNWNKNNQIEIFLFGIRPGSDAFDNYEKYGITKIKVEKTFFNIPITYNYNTKNKDWNEIKKTNENNYNELLKLYHNKKFKYMN